MADEGHEGARVPGPELRDVPRAGTRAPRGRDLNPIGWARESVLRCAGLGWAPAGRGTGCCWCSGVNLRSAAYRLAQLRSRAFNTPFATRCPNLVVARFVAPALAS